MLQQIAPKCHLSGETASSVANAKSLGWLGLTTQHEGAETTDEDGTEGMHSWLTAQIDAAPGGTGKCGIDLQATTSSITDLRWPSADLNALADP